jgi:hypothetical protein
MSLAQSTNKGHICPQRSLPTKDIYVPSTVYQQGTYMSPTQSTNQGIYVPSAVKGLIEVVTKVSLITSVAYIYLNLIYYYT